MNPSRGKVILAILLGPPLFYIVVIEGLHLLHMGPPLSFIVRLNFRTLQARGGNRDAIYELSRTDEVAEREKWLLRAAELGHPRALHSLGTRDKQWRDRGVELKVMPCLLEAAQAYRFGWPGYQKDPGRSDALYKELERIHLQSRRLPMDLETVQAMNGVEIEAAFIKLRRDFEKALQRGDSKAGRSLFYLLEGLDDASALQYLTRSAEIDPDSADLLAACYQHGERGIQEDKEAFYKWFLHARELRRNKGPGVNSSP